MTKEVLGNTIKESRIRSGLTQEELAEKLDISVTHMKHIESGHRAPSIDVLFNIMTALSMSIDDIIFKSSSTNRELRYAELLLKKCSKRDLSILIATMNEMLKKQ